MSICFNLMKVSKCTNLLQELSIDSGLKNNCLFPVMVQKTIEHVGRDSFCIQYAGNTAIISYKSPERKYCLLI